MVSQIPLLSWGPYDILRQGQEKVLRKTYGMQQFAYLTLTLKDKPSLLLNTASAMARCFLSIQPTMLPPSPALHSICSALILSHPESYSWLFQATHLFFVIKLCSCVKIHIKIKLRKKSNGSTYSLRAEATLTQSILFRGSKVIGQRTENKIFHQ